MMVHPRWLCGYLIGQYVFSLWGGNKAAGGFFGLGVPPMPARTAVKEGILVTQFCPLQGRP
jgi:hypothetical protein